jgi:phosphate transport system substrate-binding protein
MKTIHQSLLILAFALSPFLTKSQNTIVNTNTETISPGIQEISALEVQTPKKLGDKIVLVTGVRFAYPLVQKWIDDYNKENPNVQIVIESRGIADPAKYDLLIEAYDPDGDVAKNREYVYVARYAVLPVANSSSAFSQKYSVKGLNKDLITQLFFNNIYSDKDEEEEVKAPYTIYTRLQKAGSPIVFTKYFGHDTKDIKGTAIAGSDEHLLKAILRDSTAVSYLPLTLIYDRTSKNPVAGLSVLPVDLNGNGKVSDEEKFYNNLPSVIQQLEKTATKDINNVPVVHLNISVDKTNVSAEAIEFIRWIIKNGQEDLHDFGYLKPDPGRFDAEKFARFASKHTK